MASTSAPCRERGLWLIYGLFVPASLDALAQHIWEGPVAKRTEKVAESVARQILQDIQRNHLEAGAMLPPESAMVERSGVDAVPCGRPCASSRSTVR